jgi:succinate dehydrogenase/fumarate reductase flavoprotein subunit
MKEKRNMKKLIIGMALFSGVAVLALAGAAGKAFAADPAAEGGGTAAAAGGGAAAGGDDGNTQYKAKTVYDFEDDTVEGDLQRPDGELVSAQKKAEHSSLIEIRKDFIPEMLKTLEDI